LTDTTAAVIVGAGLAGLVAATELAAAGRRVIVLDQESEASLGGQAFWSLGGLFLVNSPEQRRLGVRDSFELAMQDWLGSAGFDRAEDEWPRRWAEAYVAWAAGEKRSWLRSLGIRFFPIVGWAERGGYSSLEHGNSVPRFHIVWGTGPGVLAPFVERVRDAERRGLITLRFRHRATEIVESGGVVLGCAPPGLAGAKVTDTYPRGATVLGATNEPTGWRGGTGKLELLLRRSDGEVRWRAVAGGHTAEGPVCWAQELPGPAQPLHYYRLAPAVERD